MSKANTLPLSHMQKISPFGCLSETFRYTSQSAKGIAYALGYDDYSCFSRLFSKHVGVPPSVYAKNLK